VEGGHENVVFTLNSLEFKISLRWSLGQYTMSIWGKELWNAKNGLAVGAKKRKEFYWKSNLKLRI